jgi:hypothetical protein
MQIFNCNTPKWFLGIGMSLELLFALVTILIAFFAYRTYKIAKQREILLFSIAFFSIGIGYLQEVIYNSSLIFGFTRTSLIPIIGSSANFLNLGLMVGLIHMITFIFGLSLLIYTIWPKRNKKLFGVIVGLALIGLLTSGNVILTFFLITSLMFFTLTLHYYQIFERKKTKYSLYLFMGFFALFLGHIQLAAATNLSMLFIASHITTFFGFLLLLINLLRAIKSED